MAYKKTWTDAEKAVFEATRKARVESASATIIEQFKSGDLPAALAPKYLNKSGIPSDSWSIANWLLMMATGTKDARTCRDWGKVGRAIVKGEKASVFILEPNKITIRGEDKETGEETVKTFLRGFKVGARFGIEQTIVSNCFGSKGKSVCARCKGPLDRDNPKTCSKAVELWAKHSTKDKKTADFMKTLPLLNVAKAWGLEVSSMSGRWGNAQGCFWRNMAGEGKGISLAVENLATWAHELIHAADSKLNTLVEKGQHHISETVAELGGAILLHCIGLERDADVGGAWKYIESYCKAAEVDPIVACMKVLRRVGAAVAVILETAEQLESEIETVAAVA